MLITSDQTSAMESMLVFLPIICGLIAVMDAFVMQWKGVI